MEYKTLKFASQDTIVQTVPNTIQSSHVLLAPTIQEPAFRKKMTVPIVLVENTVKLLGCLHLLVTARQAIIVLRELYLRIQQMEQQEIYVLWDRTVHRDPVQRHPVQLDHMDQFKVSFLDLIPRVWIQ